jgi:hypothetical protein
VAKRRKGIRAPERLRTPALDRAVDLLGSLGFEELIVLRHVVSDRIGRASDYLDSTELCDLQRELVVIQAIEHADYAKRQATGEGLVTVADYDAYKPETAPSRATIFRVLGKWQHAKDKAGISGKRIAQAELVRRDGRAASRTQPWTEPEIIRVLAYVMELFGGVEPTERMYGYLRADRLDWPGWGTFAGRSGPFGRDKDDWFDLVKAFVLEHGASDYPRTFARLSRLREVGRV